MCSRKECKGEPFQNPYTGLFHPLVGYRRRRPCPLRHLTATSSARCTGGHAVRTAFGD